MPCNAFFPAGWLSPGDERLPILGVGVIFGWFCWLLMRRHGARRTCVLEAEAMFSWLVQRRCQPMQLSGPTRRMHPGRTSWLSRGHNPSCPAKGIHCLGPANLCIHSALWRSLLGCLPMSVSVVTLGHWIHSRQICTRQRAERTCMCE